MLITSPIGESASRFIAEQAIQTMRAYSGDEKVTSVHLLLRNDSLKNLHYISIMVTHPERRKCQRFLLTLGGTLHWILCELLVLTLMAQDWDPNNTRLTSSKLEPRMVAQNPPVRKTAFSNGIQADKNNYAWERENEMKTEPS